MMARSLGFENMAQEHRPIFGRRHGHIQGVIDTEFPESARRGLYHLLDEYVERDFIAGWDDLGRELYRVGRVQVRYPELGDDEAAAEVLNRLLEITWVQVFGFVERIYASFLVEVTKTVRYGYSDQHEDVVATLAEVREEFERGINVLMDEEGFVYQFEKGYFVRPGKAHLQATSERANKVLVRPELEEARRHFNKAQGFFRKAPQPDLENVVKEAAVALEAAAKALFPDCADTSFETVLKRLEQREKIPGALTAGMSKLVAYRGAAQGVAHGGANGGPVNGVIAELYLAQVAADIVFLSDWQSSTKAEVPF